MKAFIFDLDGVLVDTAKYHYIAWKTIGTSFNFNLTETQNESLKGISRTDSLDLMLEWAGTEMNLEQKEVLLRQKNEHYLELIQEMDRTEILPGVLTILDFAKDNNVPVALGSASKNAQLILKKLDLLPYFDSIVDGTHVTHSKPNPEVFLLGAKNLKTPAKQCVVFEDAAAGVAAAKAAQMVAVGIGDAKELAAADYIFSSLESIDSHLLQSLAAIS
ncbi:MAG: beta-phosphoglucomutase [Flavobacteriales bacterium]|jgi:beta-phosphoglucomutase|tara:strand:- start:92 stop:745 length:654 start_codon:yes stop_codon:yes gene_type:complete